MFPLSVTTVRPPPRRQSKVVAVFSYRYDACLVPALIENISPFIHAYVAFDDRGSGDALSEEPYRRNALHDAARAEGADWILAMDPDERFEQGMEARMPYLTPRGETRRIWRFNLREMVSPDTYRTDGPWGTKTQIRLYPASATLTPLEKSLHGYWITAPQDYDVTDAGLNLYHLRHASPVRTQHRRDTYAAIDPDRRYVLYGYDYLADARGARTTTIPPDRQFLPPHVEDDGLWAPPDLARIGAPGPDPLPTSLTFLRLALKNQGCDNAAYVAADLAARNPDDSDLRSLAARLAQAAGRPRDALDLLGPDRRDNACDALVRARAHAALGDVPAARQARNRLLRRFRGSAFLAAQGAGIVIDNSVDTGPRATWRRWCRGPANLTEGARNGPGPLAVIVIGLHAPPDIAQAVASVADQSDTAEIVVVNSGGGDIRTVLGPLADRVRLIAVEARLFVGAARNIGIAASRAPYVAFLASDCTALPGWVDGRVAAHASGAAIVSSAVVPERPDTLVGTLVRRFVFPRRAPDLNQDAALHYGRSYRREVFDEAGVFAPGLRVAEDTDFNRRTQRIALPVWRPDVAVRHRDPATLGQLLRGIARRAQRAAIHNRPTGSGTSTDWIDRAIRSRREQLHDPYLNAPPPARLPRWILAAGDRLALGAYRRGLSAAQPALARAEAAAAQARDLLGTDPEGARAAAAEAVRLAPQSWAHHSVQAHVLVQTANGDPAALRAAISAWHRCLARNPQAVYAFRRLGVISARLGTPTDGLRAAERAAATAPHHPKVHLILTELAEKAARPDLAEFHALTALAADPADPEVHRTLARLHTAAGRHQMARYRTDMADVIEAHAARNLTLT